MHYLNDKDDKDVIPGIVQTLNFKRILGNHITAQ